MTPSVDFPPRSAFSVLVSSIPRHPALLPAPCRRAAADIAYQAFQRYFHPGLPNRPRDRHEGKAAKDAGTAAMLGAPAGADADAEVGDGKPRFRACAWVASWAAGKRHTGYAFEHPPLEGP